MTATSYIVVAPAGIVSVRTGLALTDEAVACHGASLHRLEDTALPGPGATRLAMAACGAVVPGPLHSQDPALIAKHLPNTAADIVAAVLGFQGRTPLRGPVAFYRVADNPAPAPLQPGDLPFITTVAADPEHRKLRWDVSGAVLADLIVDASIRAQPGRTEGLAHLIATFGQGRDFSVPTPSPTGRTQGADSAAPPGRRES